MRQSCSSLNTCFLLFLGTSMCSFYASDLIHLYIKVVHKVLLEAGEDGKAAAL